MIDDARQSSAEELRPKRLAQNWKQAVAIIVVAALLWIPMVCYIFFWWDDFSPTQTSMIGFVNLVVATSLLAFIYRRWIRHLK